MHLLMNSEQSEVVERSMADITLERIVVIGNVLVQMLR